MYGVTTLEHPAVNMIALERGKYYLGGKVEVSNRAHNTDPTAHDTQYSIHITHAIPAATPTCLHSAAISAPDTHRPCSTRYSQAAALPCARINIT